MRYSESIISKTSVAKNFIIRAGSTAINHIKQNGLTPQDLSVIPAAAGGPKWIVLYGLDKYLLSEWLVDRQKPLTLIGSSAGAWRMLCYALDDPLKALSSFLTAYIDQRYSHLPSPEVVSQNVVKVLEQILESNSQIGLWENTNRRLYVISSQSHFKPKQNSSYKLQFGWMAAKNLMSRSLLSHELNRIVFTNSDAQPIVEDGFNTTYLRFTPANLISGLQSTGTLPIYMDPVSGVKGIDGQLWDGALIDYHICHQYHDEGLIFYPHFTDKLIAGWFDKFVPWRKANGAFKDRMIMISPSDTFVQSLPDQKIPDREDFNRYFDDNDTRIQNWYEVAKRGEDIATEFDKLYNSGALIDHIELL